MNKKDYKAIAKVLKETLDGFGDFAEAREAIESIIRGLEVVFRYDNSMFDAEKFRKAIYDEEN